MELGFPKKLEVERDRVIVNYCDKNKRTVCKYSGHS